MTRKEFEDLIPETVKLLKKGPTTASALANKMKCSKPAAYRRIKAVMEDEEHGSRIFQRMVREGEKGPMSVEYFYT